MTKDKIDPWAGKQFDFDEVERELVKISNERALDLQAQARELERAAQDIRLRGLGTSLKNAVKRAGVPEEIQPRIKPTMGKGGIPTGFVIGDEPPKKPEGKKVDAPAEEVAEVGAGANGSEPPAK